MKKKQSWIWGSLLGFIALIALYNAAHAATLMTEKLSYTAFIASLIALFLLVKNSFDRAQK